MMIWVTEKRLMTRITHKIFLISFGLSSVHFEVELFTQLRSKSADRSGEFKTNFILVSKISKSNGFLPNTRFYAVT